MTLNSIIKNNIAIVSFIDTENKHQVKKVQIFKDNHLLLNRKSFKIGDEHLMEIMFLSKDSDDINKLKIKVILSDRVVYKHSNNPKSSHFVKYENDWYPLSIMEKLIKIITIFNIV